MWCAVVAATAAARSPDRIGAWSCRVVCHGLSLDVVAVEVRLLPEAFEPHFSEHRTFAIVDWIHARDVDRLLGSDVDAEGDVWREDGGRENQEQRHLRFLGDRCAVVDDVAIAERASAAELVGHLGHGEPPSKVRGFKRDDQLGLTGTPPRIARRSRPSRDWLRGYRDTPCTRGSASPAASIRSERTRAPFGKLRPGARETSTGDPGV